MHNQVFTPYFTTDKAILTHFLFLTVSVACIIPAICEDLHNSIRTVLFTTIQL